MHSVLLPVGADLYAVPIDWVREVLGAPTVTPLATAPPVVLGLINVRGEIVPLLDTAALLGVGMTGTAEFAVVVNTPHGPAALAVTGFPQRAELTVAVGGSELPGTIGTFRLDRQVVVVLDPDVLLGSERLGVADVAAIPHQVGSG